MYTCQINICSALSVLSLAIVVVIARGMSAHFGRGNMCVTMVLPPERQMVSGVTGYLWK